MDRKRIFYMVIGNLIMGLGIAIFRLSLMGNDPFTGMNLSLAELFGISFPIFQIGINLLYFIIEVWLGRHLIGLGTIVNALGLGYFVSFALWILKAVFGQPTAILPRVLLVLIGVLTLSFGLSLYQTADMGVSPYDALSLIMTERIAKLPYFWARVITDACCALVCYLTGGIIGLGTLVTAFGLGPFIHFFTVHFSEKVMDVSSRFETT